MPSFSPSSPPLCTSEALSTEFLIFGPLGLSGGIAFLLVSGPREPGEGNAA